MKSILLTTTAIVAFAGAAAADGHAGVSFGGDASLGYNDDSTFGEDGFFWGADLDVTMSATLDNGLTATASFEFDIVDDTNGQATVSDSYVLSLESENAGLFFGDTGFAAETRWSGAGDMEADGFSEADGENVLRGDVTVGSVDASVSYAISDAAGVLVSDTAGADGETDQLSIGASSDLGQFSVTAAYQEEADAVFGAAANAANGDYNVSEVFGIAVGASFGGADITVAYASNETADTSSTGIQVAYPFGPVTATVYYVSEDDATDEDNYGLNVAYSDGPIAVTADYDYDQGTDKWNLDGSYDVGNGLTLLAGMQNENEGDDADYYVAGTYDLGGGAELLVSYGEDDDGDQTDEIGGGDYLPGTTVELSFAF
ncbi:porin [Loktanella sp. Alg231-35]|uniref:porin n=1 Tax=Loktanella sp. Alg231-35 TaxID=1922220 RepID=UPI000D557477|nr:porin [Loktanella sp. Alg231-35]